MPQIVVTGGAGYIGSILCGRLLENPQNQVTVYDTFTYGIEPILSLINRENYSAIEGDIRSSQIKYVLKKADVVIHLAAIVGYPACNADSCGAKSVNVDGTRNIMKYLSQRQQLIYASTGSIYGKGENLYSEDVTPNPLSVYAITKYRAEQMLLERENSVSLRFSTAFGISPRMRMDLLINDLLFQAYRQKAIVVFEPNARRTFVHCQDVAESYLFTIEYFNRMRGQIFNVGNTELNLTKSELIKIMKAHIDFHVIEENYDKDLDGRDYKVDFSKIYNIGYKPKYTLNDGISSLLKLYALPSFNKYFRNA